MPALVIPGNHDDRETFRRAFCDHAYLPASGPINYVVGGHGAVRIVALDVTVPGLHHGDIDEASMHWLDGVLSVKAQRPTIIMMHQPPFDCGVPYLDTYHCRNGERLARSYRAIGRWSASSAAMSTASCNCASAARCSALRHRRQPPLPCI